MAVGKVPTVGIAEGKETFYNYLNMGVGSLGNGYSLFMLGDLNGWVGDRLGVGITDGFGVPVENDN